MDHLWQNNYLLSNDISSMLAFGNQKLMKTSVYQNLMKTTLNQSITQGSNHCSLSRDSLIYQKSEAMIAGITSIDNKTVKDFKAIDNVIDVSPGAYYKYTSKAGNNFVFDCNGIDAINTPFAKLESEFGIPLSSLSLSYLQDEERVSRFFAFLSADKSALSIYRNYSRDEVKELLASVGIEPGWVKIKNGNNVTEFFYEEDGSLWGKYQIDAQREGMNRTCWFEDTVYKYREGGKPYTKDSVFIIDGKEYKLDDKGYLHIPDDAVVLFSRTQWPDL